MHLHMFSSCKILNRMCIAFSTIWTSGKFYSDEQKFLITFLHFQLFFPFWRLLCKGFLLNLQSLPASSMGVKLKPHVSAVGQDNVGVGKLAETENLCKLVISQCSVVSPCISSYCTQTLKNMFFSVGQTLTIVGVAQPDATK